MKRFAEIPAGPLTRRSAAEINRALELLFEIGNLTVNAPLEITHDYGGYTIRFNSETDSLTVRDNETPTATTIDNVNVLTFDSLTGLDVQTTTISGEATVRIDSNTLPSYTTVQEEGVFLTQRQIINFVGAAVTAADDVGNQRTNVMFSQSPTTSTAVVGIDRTVTTTSPMTGGGDLSADRALGIGGLTNLGTGNYIVGVNAGATAWEYKQFAAGQNISMTHAVGSITISALQADSYLPADITSTTLASDQTDYSPTGIATANVLRLGASANVIINSLDGNSDGRFFIVLGMGDPTGGSKGISFVNEAIVGTAAKRFALDDSNAHIPRVTLYSGDVGLLWYDNTKSRWRFFGNNLIVDDYIVSSGSQTFSTRKISFVNGPLTTDGPFIVSGNADTGASVINVRWGTEIQSVGATNSAGILTKFARVDHIHKLNFPPYAGGGSDGDAGRYTTAGGCERTRYTVGGVDHTHATFCEYYDALALSYFLG